MLGLHDYLCGRCGAFTAMQPMAEMRAAERVPGLRAGSPGARSCTAPYFLRDTWRNGAGRTRPTRGARMRRRRWLR